MADQIGVARRWYQGDHYDIAMSKRALAVAAGAIEIPMRSLAVMAIERRRTGNLPSPSEVERLVAERIARLKASYPTGGGREGS